MELAQRLESASLPAGRDFLRIEAPVEGTDLLQWLRGVPAGSRRYFRDRGAKVEIAGVGCAVSEAFGEHDRVGDLIDVQPFVFQGAEAAFAGAVLPGAADPGQNV